MADKSAANYQRHEADIEDTEDSESSSDTSSDSMDLHEAELEISTALDSNKGTKQCEVYSNPVIDFDDSIEQRKNLLYSNPQCSQNMESEASFSHESHCNKNIEASEASFSHESHCNKNIEASKASFSHESHCNKNIEASEASFSHESHCNKNIMQSEVWPDLEFECNAAVEASHDLLDTDCNKLVNVFPLNVIQRRLNKQRTDDVKFVKIDAAVYMAAVIEYMAREVLDLAMSCAQISQSSRIKPRHLMTAIQCDEEMGKLFNELKHETEDPS